MSRIIVLSYGIRRQTKRALEQARRFGHEIQLVPAIPSATRGLRTHQSSLVTVHDLVGREGLRAALADASGPVLMLHEDVLLHPDAAARLLEVAESTRMIAVPRTNHDDVDGPAGQLPGDVVQPLGPEEEPYQIERARTVCLAGPALLLRGLTAQRLTAAATRLYFQDRTALLVPDAVATHLDLGPDQLEAPVGPDGRPLLVASMIVKDEEMFLEDCLASLEGLVDRIDICDTGSTDRTVEIAEAAGATVTHVEWRDDFAWARNQALEMSKDAWWVMQVDADERVRVADPIAFRRFLATALADGEGFDVPLRDVAVDGSELGGQQLPRIFLGESTVFRGRVHEVAEFRDGRSIAWAVTTELEVEHHGYRPEVIEARDKKNRNLRLARVDHEASPSPITGLQMVRSLPWGDERLTLLRELYEQIKDGDEHLNEAGQVPIFQLLAQGLLHEGRTEESWSVIQEARGLFPHVPSIRATHAEIGTKLRRHEDVLAAATNDAAHTEGARPWADTVSDAVAMIELAKSQLAVGDVETSGATIVTLLETGVPAPLNRWLDIVSVVALTVPERAVELLSPAAAQDVSGACILAVGAAFDPPDAASFALDVVLALDAPSSDQQAAAVRLSMIADRADVLAQLVDNLGLDKAQLRADAPQAGARVSAYLDGLLDLGARVADDDPVAGIIEALRDGQVLDPEEAALVLSRDPSGAGLSKLARVLDTADSATVAAATVAASAREFGAAPDDIVWTALSIIVVAGDDDAARVVVPHLGRQDPALIESLVRRSVGSGATGVAASLARALFLGGTDAVSTVPFPEIVRVLGMHRSSTSAYAHVLRALGADAGPEDELIPAAPDNPRGFHEHRPLVLAADQLLASLGGSWDAPPPRQAISTPLGAALTHGAVSTLERLAAGRSGPVLWKDPRLCLLLGLWDDALADRMTTRDVHVLRPPDEVAASLHRRSAMLSEHAARLWVRYVADALAARPDAPVFLSDELFSDAGSTIDRLAAATGLTPDDPARTHARSLIDEGLQVRRVVEADAGPWLRLARAMYETATAGDLRGASALGQERIDAQTPDPHGLPLVLPRGDASLEGLGLTASPVTLLQTESSHASRYRAASQGFVPVDGPISELIGALRPSAVWVESHEALHATSMALTIHAPRTPLGSAAETELADAVVPAGDAVSFVTEPPTPETSASVIPQLPLGQVKAGVTSVVIPVFGRWAITSACLDALRSVDDGPIEVIVVDDASLDDTVIRATDDPRIDQLVALPTNRGFPGAVNAGLAAATGEFVCILNNDTEVMPGWLSSMHRELARDGVAMVGPRSNSISGPQAIIGAPPVVGSLDRVRGWGERYLSDAPARSWPLDRLVGFCLLVRRDLMAIVGGLDEGVGRGNFEDDELCARLSYHGTLRVVDDSLVLHIGSATFGGGDGWRRAMLVGARHVHDRLLDRVSAVRGVVLSDGNLEMTMRSLVALSRIAGSLTVVERGDGAATRSAVRRVASAIDVVEVDWATSTGTWASLLGHDDHRVLIVLAGEEVIVSHRAEALIAIEATQAGQLPGLTGLRVLPSDEAIDLASVAGGAGATISGLASA
jgi:GT2 family glycosyltransferase